jgi:hypothetical protein
VITADKTLQKILGFFDFQKEDRGVPEWCLECPGVESKQVALEKAVLAALS